MDRRKFIKAIGATSLITGGALVSAPVVHAKKTIKWKMVTTWPKNFPGLGTGANFLAKLIEDMSGGRMQVKVYGAGELVPPFEVFDAVSAGTAQMGHAASFYWKGKSPAAQFFAGVPYGLTGQEMNGWLYHGGGMDLWKEVYAPFGLVPAAAGNSGVQMAGWFNKEINSMADLKGLKMRIPGLGGDVLKKAGGTPVNIPGGEIYSSLKSGAIDATEWIGPYNDLAFGLYKAAKYYYYPGWHEPGTSLECTINKKALEELPKDLQSIVLQACRVSSDELTAEYTARNASALQTLKTKHKVQVKRLPDDVLENLRALSEEVVADVASKDPVTAKVYESYHQFRKQAIAWSNVSERAYLNAREL
ncbi:MAG: TRAP transporter substrate-binding protein [Gammaproteobacteria bacterium]|nr:TRAP transporter substrate-binding protein [Gammaproteobacteria bacterium]